MFVEEVAEGTVANVVQQGCHAEQGLDIPPARNALGHIRKLRDTANYKFTPIIMLTTESQESKRHEGRQVGASGWIVKPFTPDQLLGVVKKFVK